jgi:hypothetical protein
MIESLPIIIMVVIRSGKDDPNIEKINLNLRFNLL